MNMSMTVSSFEASESAAVSTLLKPAVLGVTEEKKLTSICSPRGMSAFMRLRSMKKKSTAPPSISDAVDTSTSLVWRSYRRQCRPLSRMSSQTRKPMPPRTMSSIIVMLTSASSEYDTSEEKGAFTPMRSKPALQKAETEWKTEYHSPLPSPNSGMKRMDSSTAPESSKMSVPRPMVPVISMMRPTRTVFMLSAMTPRSRMLMRRRSSREKSVAMVMKPRPPIWMSRSITTCPKPDQ